MRSASGPETAPALYIHGTENAASSASASAGSPGGGWARPGAAIHHSEAEALSLHLDAQPTLKRPILPEPHALDPALERARIERELGVPELAASLDQYGTPPVAPPPEHIDQEALEREMVDTALASTSRWSVRVRRGLRRRARNRAAHLAEADDERLAAEQRQLQMELDNRWAELRALRHRAAQEADEWVSKETARRTAAHSEQQATADREWQRGKDADPESVTTALRSALPEWVTALGFLDGVTVLIVSCPHRDELIANTEPAFTSDHQRAVRARSEMRRNDLYLAAIASRVLAAVGGALSVTPAMEAAVCVAIRPCESGTALLWEPLYVGTFERAYSERLLAEARWSSDPALLAAAIKQADEVHLELHGSTHEVAALDLATDPGLATLMDELTSILNADMDAAATPGQEAVVAFLGSADLRQEGDIEGDNEETAVREPPEMVPTQPPAMAVTEVQALQARESREAVMHGAPDTPAPEPSVQAQSTTEEGATGSWPADGMATSRDATTSGPHGDPLEVALKDSDGSVRRAAVEAIGRRNDPNDTALLLRSLSDQDDIVRLEAMYALKDRLSPDFRREALITACSDSDGGVRRKAIEALAELGDERDTPMLLEALNDPNDHVRLEAIYAVRYRLAPDMRSALIDACSDVDEGVRRKAVEALAELGDERDTPLLLKALKDSDSSVRLEAVYALEGRSTLGLSSRLSEPLLEAMQADDAVVRQAAVRLLGRLQQPRTDPPPA